MTVWADGSCFKICGLFLCCFLLISWLLFRQTLQKDTLTMKKGVKVRVRRRDRAVVGRIKNIITAAGPLVYFELESRVAAALVAIKQVDTNVFTSMIHHSTHILSCRLTRCKCIWTLKQNLVETFSSAKWQIICKNATKDPEMLAAKTTFLLQQLWTGQDCFSGIVLQWYNQVTKMLLGWLTTTVLPHKLFFSFQYKSIKSAIWPLYLRTNILMI